MATLQDLCKSVPQAMTEVKRECDRRRAEQAEVRRKNQGYLQRMERLNAERNVFGCCQQRRPQKGKYRNGASREEAGTCGNIVMGIRTGAYTVVVCKSRNMFN